MTLGGTSPDGLVITRIETVPVRARLAADFKGSHYHMTHRATIITRVYTENGDRGIRRPLPGCASSGGRRGVSPPRGRRRNNGGRVRGHAVATVHAAVARGPGQVRTHCETRSRTDLISPSALNAKSRTAMPGRPSGVSAGAELALDPGLDAAGDDRGRKARRGLRGRCGPSAPLSAVTTRRVACHAERLGEDILDLDAFDDHGWVLGCMAGCVSSRPPDSAISLSCSENGRTRWSCGRRRSAVPGARSLLVVVRADGLELHCAGAARIFAVLRHPPRPALKT